MLELKVDRGTSAQDTHIVMTLYHKEQERVIYSIMFHWLIYLVTR
jgi:hypothetical protein